MSFFRALDFLSEPPGFAKNLALAANLKTDPERLRQEFLAIATDSNERFDFRTRSLMVLSRHAAELKAFRSAEVTQVLMAAFRKEFPPKKLEKIRQSLLQQICTAEAFLAHQFCIAFVSLSADDTQEAIDSVRQALRGTELEGILTRHLEILRRKAGG